MVIELVLVVCSVGSLGGEAQEAGVQNITVRAVEFTGTQNGLRIKTWAKPSNGFVKGVTFEHAVMKNVQNPIVVDQNYCPGTVNCPGPVILEPSAAEPKTQSHSLPFFSHQCCRAQESRLAR